MQVYVVDDDRDLQQSLRLLLERAGHTVQLFVKAEAFIAVQDILPPGCVLLDLKLPGIGGLEAQRLLREAGSVHRVILLTGFGEVPEAVAAMRAGATDFLGKPFRSAELLDALDRAASDLADTLAQRRRDDRYAAIADLSAKEHEVLIASMAGGSSKQVAFNMGLSVRTVEMHRSSIIRKLDVANFAAALLMASAAGLARGDDIHGTGTSC